MGHHRTGNVVIDRHGQGEPAGQAHSDDADAPLAPRVERLTQRPKPVHDGACLAPRKRHELRGDAHLDRAEERAQRPATARDQCGEIDGEAALDHPFGEVDEHGTDPKELVDDDDRWSAAAPIHRMRASRRVRVNEGRESLDALGHPAGPFWRVRAPFWQPAGRHRWR